MSALENSVRLLLSNHQVISDVNRVAWALKAMTLTDLTTLAGDDTNSNVERLCFRACYPFVLKFNEGSSEDEKFLKKLHVAAVCVYPTKVKDAYECLKRMNMLEHIQIASGLSKFSFFHKLYCSTTERKFW